MEKRGLQIKGSDFVIGSRPVILRGVGLGNYMNIEHFMFGLPGAECQIRKAIETVYGEQNAALFWNRFHSSFLTDEDFAWYKSLGLNSVRLAMNYRHFEQDDNPGHYRSEGFELVDRVLKMGERHSLCVILDMHSAPGCQNPDWHSDNITGTAQFWYHKDCRERLVSLWKALARRYRDNPWVGGYDLLNEPVPADRTGAGQMVDSFHHLAAAAIRSVDRNHIIFVEGDFYAQDTRQFIPFKDPQIACSVHYYPFFGLANDLDNRQKLTEKERISQVTESFKRSVSVEDIQGRLKRPVWCGETGIPLTVNHRQGMEQLLDDTLQSLEKQKVSWTLWNGKDARAMGILRPAENSPWMEISRRIKPFFDIGHELYTARQEAEAAVSKWDLEDTKREESIRDVQFRLLAIRQLEEGSRMEKVLKGVPFPELLKALESFRFENCEVWPAVEASVKKAAAG
jgi:hypothetical protein